MNVETRKKTKANKNHKNLDDPGNMLKPEGREILEVEDDCGEGSSLVDLYISLFEVVIDENYRPNLSGQLSAHHAMNLVAI
jgi:hypothetical protein